MTFMLVSGEDKIANEWNKYQGYTTRPLASTVSYYQKWIRNCSQDNPQGRFLLYGGTPEIRSIFQEQNIKLSIFDRSEEMVRAMGRLTCDGQPVSANEYFRPVDWIQMGEVKNTFNCLVGDDAINMIPWNRFDQFLRNAHELLDQAGIFICHLLIKPCDELIDQNFFEVMKEYKQGRIKSHFDLASRLNFICYNRNEYSMGWQQTINKIGVNKLQSLLPSFDFINLFGSCNSKFYCPPQHEFDKLLSNYFDIREIFYPDEHEYCLYEPVYVLKKN